MNIEPRVADALVRIADIVPLTPLARMELDGVLTALLDEVRQEARQAERAEIVALAETFAKEWPESATALRNFTRLLRVQNMPDGPAEAL